MRKEGINKPIDLVMSIERHDSKNSTVIHEVNARAAGEGRNVCRRIIAMNEAGIDKDGLPVMGNDHKIGANVRPETLKRWHALYLAHGFEGLMILPRDARIKRGSW